MQFESLSITNIQRETEDSLLITLAASPALSSAFHSGQHLTVKADINGAALYRTYSICQPACRRTIEIGVRVINGGLMSEYLAQQRQGDKLLVGAPIGTFYLHTSPTQFNDNILFIAGGSGITPIIGMLEELMLSQPQSRATLLYANRTLSSTMFFERLMQMKNRFIDRLETHLFFTREQTLVDWRSCRLNADTLEKLTQRGMLPYKNYDACYLCGPIPMMESCRDFLHDPIPNIYTEAFGTANTTTRTVTLQQTAPPAEPIARVQIVIDGVQREFDFCADDYSVLEAAKRHKIALPFSCTGGVCGTCRAKVLSGKADMKNNYALEADDINKGFVLSCQAKPLSDNLSLSFDY
ncbi:MAG: 2Fe-2S iron-sulfur cluster binding domain-containing protein [Proteobacteria bacterium]|nr:2Fe-2S iron-sulfur cluster binding domain-containing protein [Pseudomonadota bacterium]